MRNIMSKTGYLRSLTIFILTFLPLIIFCDTSYSIKKYRPQLKYSLITSWFEFIPSNSKIGVLSTAMDQLEIKKFIFKTVFNTHTKNVNLDYDFRYRKDKINTQQVHVWINEDREEILGKDYYPKYTGIGFKNKRTVGFGRQLITGMEFYDTDKSEGVLELYKGKRINLILELKSLDYTHTTDYPNIKKDLSYQKIMFKKDFKYENISEFLYVNSTSLLERNGIQLKGTLSYNRLSNIPVYDPLILLRPIETNHLRGFKKEVYANKMIKGAADLKKRLYKNMDFKIGHAYSLKIYGNLFFDHLDATLGSFSHSYSTYGLSLDFSSLLLGKIPFTLSLYFLKDDDKNTGHFSTLDLSLIRF